MRTCKLWFLSLMDFPTVMLQVLSVIILSAVLVQKKLCSDIVCSSYGASFILVQLSILSVSISLLQLNPCCLGLLGVFHHWMLRPTPTLCRRGFPCVSLEPVVQRACVGRDWTAGGRPWKLAVAVIATINKSFISLACSGSYYLENLQRIAWKLWSEKTMKPNSTRTIPWGWGGDRVGVLPSCVHVRWWAFQVSISSAL